LRQPHTETDDYSTSRAGIARGLDEGVSGADWYDKTVKEAMQIAEEHPGIAKDLTRNSSTPPFAITSQVRPRSECCAADQAYTYFPARKLPDRHQAKKASIAGNLKKMNERPGGGSIGKVREFLTSR
jgi:hypothetical protein